MALAVPDIAGEHSANLDDADERSPKYLDWVADLVRPHLGEAVLDLGAGIGAITERYADGRQVVAADMSSDCVSALQKRFARSPNVTAVQQDLREFEGDGRQFDSVVMVNVLEHIEDDAGALAKVRRLITPSGTIVLYVPALNGLYGRWDRKAGHYRRYSKWRMREVAGEAGLDLVELRYVNALAIPAWIAFSLTDVDRTQRASISMWDRTGVPLTRALERWVRVPIGLNLLAVLRRGPEPRPRA
jgi:SAM-dependent methyltransferase